MYAPAASPVAAPLQVTCPHLVPIISKGHVCGTSRFSLKLKTNCPDAAERQSYRHKPRGPCAWLCWEACHVMHSAATPCARLGLFLGRPARMILNGLAYCRRPHPDLRRSSAALTRPRCRCPQATAPRAPLCWTRTAMRSSSRASPFSASTLCKRHTHCSLAQSSRVLLAGCLPYVLSASLKTDCALHKGMLPVLCSNGRKAAKVMCISLKVT